MYLFIEILHPPPPPRLIQKIYSELANKEYMYIDTINFFLKLLCLNYHYKEIV